MVPVSFAPFLFADEAWGLSAHGAVWWPRAAALIVADLHLEKASWFAARGQMLPPYDSRVTLERLVADVQACGARHIFALGDSFHDAAGPARLEPGAAALLARLDTLAGITWIAGNHETGRRSDAAPVAVPCGRWIDEAQIHGIRLRHEADPAETAPELSGHFHPKLRIPAPSGRGGRRIARSCLLRTARRMILPAYGALTGGLDATAPAIRAALGPDGDIDALIAASGRIAQFRVWTAASAQRTA